MADSKLGQALEQGQGQPGTPDTSRNALRGALEDVLDAAKPSDAAKKWFDDYWQVAQDQGEPQPRSAEVPSGLPHSPQGQPPAGQRPRGR